MDKRIILDEKEREFERMKEKFKEARNFLLIQRSRWRRQSEKTIPLLYIACL